MHKIYLVSHTHWDREWYEPFQIFRLRLIRCIDKLLEVFETDPEYRHFLLDGQTIVLEDYLQVRPERAPDLERLVRSKKLDIGPWYVLPDEFLVSGEALIRNLSLGIAMASQLGGAMPLGYIPDPFGHISQMPQLLAGFGIRAALFRRGLADEPVELWWQGSDGTRVLACYLRDGYDNAAWLAHDQDGFADGLEAIGRSLRPYSATHALLALNGTDHMEPWQDLTTLLRAARARVVDMDLVHGSLPMYVAHVEKEIDANHLELGLVRGELRNPKRHHLLPGVASARIWIKQRNAAAEVLLEKWLEPLVAYTGSDPTPVRLAWKYLLQNHTHDSIGGCGVDAAHADMRPRFEWVEQIANTTIRDCLELIGNRINTASTGADQVLIVFNPHSERRTDRATAVLELPPGKRLGLYDEIGSAIPFHVAPLRTDENGTTHFAIEFIASDVPGHGYRIIQAQFCDSTAADIYSQGSQTTSIQNEYYHIAVQQDEGTLTVLDKRTGAVYSGVNRFVDGGDRGDLYNYCPPPADLLIALPAVPPRISVQRTRVRETITIEMVYRLPASLGSDRMSRALDRVDEKISVSVSLIKQVRRIDFRTEVENAAKDHRLRVEFPSPILTDRASAAQAYDVVDRLLEIQSGTEDWVEQPRPEAPMQGFVSLTDGNTGLMLATRGLPEYEARRESAGTTLILTLLRCTGWLSRGDLSTRAGDAGPRIETPGAQEIGRHIFEYALIPHAGNWRNGFQEAHAFMAPLRACATGIHSGPLPSFLTFVECSQREFVVSAIKSPEHGKGLVIRGYNLSEEPTQVSIAVWRRFQQAWRCNLNEEELATLDLEDGRRIAFVARAKEIVTIKLE